jgi:hypothetical protein
MDRSSNSAYQYNPDKTARPLTGEELVLIGSNWWIEEVEPGCEREETIPAIS